MGGLVAGIVWLPAGSEQLLVLVVAGATAVVVGGVAAAAVGRAAWTARCELLDPLLVIAITIAATTRASSSAPDAMKPGRVQGDRSSPGLVELAELIAPPRYSSAPAMADAAPATMHPAQTQPSAFPCSPPPP